MTGTPSHNPDIVVIGVGPAGSRVATGLADAGIKVLVCEQFPFAGHKKSCTGIIGQECTVLAQVPDSLVKFQANSASLMRSSGKILHVARKEVQASVIDRTDFDKLMAIRAADAGAEFLYSTKVIDMERNQDSFLLTLSGDNGRLSTVEAAAVVVATGAYRTLSKRVGLSLPRDSIYGVQALVDNASVNEVEVYFGDEVAPGGFAWLVPGGNGKLKAGLLARARPGEYFGKFLAKRVSDGKITVADTPDLNYGVIPLRPPRRSYAERLLLVGDAAGQVKPLTGGGIYYGLLSADIAAGVMTDAVKKNDFSAQFLSVYEKMWRQKIGSELRRGYVMRRIHESMQDGGRERLFAIIEKYGVAEALAAIPELNYDWHGPVITAMVKQVIRQRFKRVPSD